MQYYIQRIKCLKHLLVDFYIFSWVTICNLSLSNENHIKFSFICFATMFLKNFIKNSLRWENKISYYWVWLKAEYSSSFCLRRMILKDCLLMSFIYFSLMQNFVKKKNLSFPIEVNSENGIHSSMMFGVVFKLSEFFHIT